MAKARSNSIVDKLLRDIDALKYFKAGREEGRKISEGLSGRKLLPRRRWNS